MNKSQRSGTRGYVASRPFLGNRTAQHIQNIVIRDYCQRHQLQYLLSITEYAMPQCFMGLEQILEEAPILEGFCCFSLFMLPESKAARLRIYERALAAGCPIHFAAENTAIYNQDDIDRIEDIWLVHHIMGQKQALF